jgi:hypothetical protein
MNYCCQSSFKHEDMAVFGRQNPLISPNLLTRLINQIEDPI